MLLLLFLLEAGHDGESIGGNPVVHRSSGLGMKPVEGLVKRPGSLGQENLSLAALGSQDQGLEVPEGLHGRHQGELGILTAKEFAIICM